MTTDESQVVSAISMLKALGVEATKDIEELMAYFFSGDDMEADTEKVPTLAAFRNLGLDPDREPDALKVLLTIIQPDDVISAIHSFVMDRKEARLLDQARTKILSLDEGGAGGGSGEGASKSRRQREKVIREREKLYWDTLGSVVSDNMWQATYDVLSLQVWRQLSKSLEGYTGLLVERDRRIKSVSSLQARNTKI
ncbi:unnamed protein product, partial [Choristocarpus tenellus]